MRITDLLDKRSISLTAEPKSKSEALDQIIDLMVKSGKINDREAYRKQVYAREEESTTGVGEESQSPMENVMRLQNLDLRPWLSKTVWNLMHWTESRLL